MSFILPPKRDPQIFVNVVLFALAVMSVSILLQIELAVLPKWPSSLRFETREGVNRIASNLATSYLLSLFLFGLVSKLPDYITSQRMLMMARPLVNRINMDLQASGQYLAHINGLAYRKELDYTETDIRKIRELSNNPISFTYWHQLGNTNGVYISMGPDPEASYFEAMLKGEHQRIDQILSQPRVDKLPYDLLNALVHLRHSELYGAAFFKRSLPGTRVPGFHDALVHFFATTRIIMKYADSYYVVPKAVHEQG